MWLTKVRMGLIALAVAYGTVGCQTAGHWTPTNLSADDRAITKEQVAFAEALAYYCQALIYEGKRDLPAALDCYHQAILRDPENMDLFFRYVQVLLHQQRKEEAVVFIEQIPLRLKNNPKALELMARVYRLSDRAEDAEGVYRKWLKLDAKNPSPYVQLADLYVRQGREAEAVVLLESSLQKVENPMDVLRVVGEVHLRMAAASLTEEDEKKFQADALEVYERIVEADPDESLSLTRLAELYALSQQYDKAVTFYEGVEKKHPKNLRVKEKLAESFLALGKQASAVEVLEDIADQQPSNPRVHTYLGELYQQMGDHAQAAASYREAIQIDPDDPSGYLKLALLLMSDNAAEAKEVLSEGLAEIPEDETLTKTLAHVYFAEKQYDEACTYFERALKVMVQEEDISVSPNFYFNYAVSAQHSGLLDKSAELLAKAIDENMAYIDVYIQFIFRQDQKEDMESAVVVLTKTAELRPDLPKIYYYMGMLTNYLKQYPESIEAFEKTIQLVGEKETDSELLSAQFYFWYGAACERDGLIERSVELFRKCIALDPEYAEALNYLAYMWAERGENLDEALEFVNRAITLMPESGAFVDTLGWIYFMKGEYELARTEIEKATVLLPDDATIMDHLGDVWLKLENQEKAMNAWRRAFVLDPTSEKVGEKLTRHGIALEPLRVEADEYRVAVEALAEIKATEGEADVAEDATASEVPGEVPEVEAEPVLSE